MKKIMIIVVGILALLVSCKTPNDYVENIIPSEIEDEEKEPETIDDSECVEKNWCEIDENVDLLSLKYFIHFNGQIVSVDKISKIMKGDTFEFIGVALNTEIRISNTIYIFNVYVTKSKNKIEVDSKRKIKNVYMENDGYNIEIHIVF